MILVTMHRRENQGEPMRRVFRVMREVVETHADIELIYPVHLNPVVQETADSILDHHSRIHLIDPLDVVDFHNLAARSYFIMTDSVVFRKRRLHWVSRFWSCATGRNGRRGFKPGR